MMGKSMFALFISTILCWSSVIATDSSDDPNFASRCVDADKAEGHPIVEIDFDSAEFFPQYEALSMDGIFNPLNNYEIIREEMQVRLIVPETNTDIPMLSGGELYGRYALREVRFAWGNKGNMPSRHILAGERFPLEMHLVHQKVPLNQHVIREASHQPKSDLAVIAVLFEESRKASPTFSSVVNMILSNRNTSDGVQLTLGKLFPQELDVFFRYEELMTDPSCNAHVSWTVFPTPARLPMKEFRRLQTLYKSPASSGTKTKESSVKDYVLEVPVRLMSPPREESPGSGLLPPDMQHRPAYALIPPSEHYAFSDAADHRGISIYHVIHEQDSLSNLRPPEHITDVHTDVLPPHPEQGYHDGVNNHEGRDAYELEHEQHQNATEKLHEEKDKQQIDHQDGSVPANNEEVSKDQKQEVISSTAEKLQSVTSGSCITSQTSLIALFLTLLATISQQYIR